MRILTVAIIATVTLACGRSQPPSPTPTKPAQNNQRGPSAKQAKAGDDQRAPDALSTAINQLAAQITEREAQNNTSHQDGNTSTDRWIMWSAIVTALATIAIAVLAYFQWRTLEEHRSVFDRQATSIANAVIEAEAAANAAIKTASATALEFELTNRPWISIEISPISDLVFDGAGMSLKVTILLKNIGKTPARSAHLRCEFHFDGANPTHVAVERARICDELMTLEADPFVIMPGGENNRIIEVRKNSNYVNAHIGAGGWIWADVITCVTYRSTFSDKTYYTGTIHHLGVQSRTEPRDWSALIKIYENIPLGHTRLDLNPVFGIIAE